MAVIEFDGSHYKGFQKQRRNRDTIQGVLEQAINHTLKEKIKLAGCSRTDAGVHAINYVINFKTNNPIPVENLLYVVNKKLPLSIYIKTMEEAHPFFHARHLARKKYYIYKILTGERPLVFEHNYKYYYPGHLDLDKMQEGLKEFIGKKNFRAFSTKQAHVDDFDRTVYDMYLTQEGKEIHLHFIGRGFVYNMLRIIAATVIDLGAGKRDIESIREALMSGDRNLRSKKAPAAGLYLQQVYY